MQSNERITELLFETGAFQVLAQPVILTSGKIGIYYINTEKLVQDGGEWKEHENNSVQMINHAVSMMNQRPTFREVIDILSEEVKPFIEEGNFTISGGQRRDWLFSGPVSANLRIPHISLHKDGSIIYIPDVEGIVSRHIHRIGGLNVIHIADLMTTGSSAYDPRNTPQTGWIPMLRNQGANVNRLFNVVTRLQGGEETLREAGVETRSLVAIDEDFVQQGYNKSLIDESQMDTALAYMRSPDEWGESYIDRMGVGPFVAAFNPKGSQLDRANKFLEVYKRVLKESGRRSELDARVREKYNNGLEGI